MIPNAMSRSQYHWLLETRAFYRMTTDAWRSSVGRSALTEARWSANKGRASHLLWIHGRTYNTSDQHEFLLRLLEFEETVAS